MDKFRVGIIGCGAIFPSHAFPLHILPNVEVKAVCDIKPAALNTAVQLFHCAGYADYHELIKRQDIDVIHVLTPHYLHASMAVEAAYAGKHVLTEKPMAIKIEDAAAMLEAAKRNKVTLGVISQNRYNAASVAVKEALQNGSLGKILGQRILMSWNKPMAYYQNSDWRGNLEKEGGSLLIDQAVHVMDLARWFVDDEIECIQANVSNRNFPAIETEDTAEGLIKYQNGVVAVFYGTNNYSYNASVLLETHCEKGIATVEFDRAVISYHNGKEITVLNDTTETMDEADYTAFFHKTSAQTAFETLTTWGVFSGPMVPSKYPRAYWGSTHIKQIRNFYTSLAAGVQPDVNAAEAIKTQEMISAIYQSGQNHQVVKLR